MKSSLIPRLKRGAVVGMAVPAVVIGASAGTAQASEVRAGAHPGQIDILLNDVETQRASSSFWGAAVTCATAGLTGGGVGALVATAAKVSAVGSGGLGLFAVGLPCVGIVSVCAAQAAAVGRDAGMTISPTGFWCWQYN
jgi:hypothetical protein